MLVTAEDKATDVRRGLLHDQKESDEVAEQTPNKGTIEHSNHDHSQHEMPVSLTTNRVKAVIFINIHALLLFGSSASLKYALNQKGVSALDASMIRTLVLIMSTAAVVFLNGASFRIAKQDRWLVIVRSLLGTLAFTSFAFGLGMVSLLAFNTILNTVPMWAGILGFLFLSEKLSLLEIVALFLSFGGVLCIAFAGKDDQDEAEAAKKEGISTEHIGSHWLGCMLILVTAFSYASVIVITRRVQQYNYAVLLFYFALFSAPVTMMLIFGDCLANRRQIMLLSYTGG